jgi:hypothetical protein
MPSVPGYRQLGVPRMIYFIGILVERDLLMQFNDDANVLIDDQIQIVTAAAMSYLAAGISCFPIAADGSKAPASWLLPSEWDERAQRNKRSWKIFQQRLPTINEITTWEQLARIHGELYGLAIVCGAISGGMEVIDLDNFDLVTPWAANVLAAAPDLLDGLVLVESPRPGLHIYFRSPACERNQRVAREQVVDTESGKPIIVTLAETRGEGGYIVAPASPGVCHPSRRPYIIAQGNVLEIPMLTIDERAVLLNAARSLNRYIEPPRPPVPPRTTSAGIAGDRPGDDFNRRANWSSILERHGWQCVFVDESGYGHWTRPGKTCRISASTNFYGNDRLHVFSSNASPFEEGRSYSKFEAHTLLNHGGDFQAAARELSTRGFGWQQPNLRAMFARVRRP